MNNTENAVEVLRYARIRGGAYLRKAMKFQEGDYVYVKKHSPTTLEPKAQPYSLRIIGIKPSGVLELMGRCGTVILRHRTSCAPFHLPNIDSHIDTSLAKPLKVLPCSVCGCSDRPASTLLCDSCNCAWHMDCLTPPLTELPRGQWYCLLCRDFMPDLPAISEPRPPATNTPAFVPRALPMPDENVGRYDGSRVRKAGRGAIVEFVLNSHTSATTGFTPFYLDTGMAPVTPLALLAKSVPAAPDVQPPDEPAVDLPLEATSEPSSSEGAAPRAVP